jgi:hypothetical protein
VGACGISTYSLWANSCASPHAHDEMGQETQKTYGYEEDTHALASRLPMACERTAPSAYPVRVFCNARFRCRCKSASPVGNSLLAAMSNSKIPALS